MVRKNEIGNGNENENENDDFVVVFVSKKING